jgi:hypothetical protein
MLITAGWRTAFKKGSIPRAVVVPSHSPHASRPSTFRAPGWGGTRVAFVLLLLEERDLAGFGTLQPSLGFKDFHHVAQLHPLTNGHPG